MAHILKDIYSSRDPDARAEAESLCGCFEECSGSGKHTMTGPDKAECDKCVAVYLKEFDYWWEKDNEDKNRLS